MENTIENVNDGIKTFKDLYLFLQSYEKNDITEWLKIRWKGKDKQESLLRLFCGLNLIVKLENYSRCKGNFNLKTIEQFNTIKDNFFDENQNLIYLKDKGDASDLSCVSKNNNKNILITTSKNIKEINIGDLDIDKILTNFVQYSDLYTMTLCICIKSIEKYEKMKSKIEQTNIQLKKYLDKTDTIIIDWNDLNDAYKKFKSNYSSINFINIINCDKYSINLKCSHGYLM